MKKVRNNIRQWKILGEFGELCFATKAASLGLPHAKPHGDSLPYDVIVDTGSGLARIQVKTVGRPYKGYYAVTTARTGLRPYSPSDFEFLAVYVVPEDTWYVIPVRALQRRTYIHLYPHNPENPRRPGSRRYERYREAWDQLVPGRAPRRIFAAADTQGANPMADVPPSDNLLGADPAPDLPGVLAGRDENVVDLCGVVDPAFQ